MWLRWLMPPRISIHAPREGSDVVVASGQTAVTVFQSTLPARGATRDRSHGERANAYFNPRSPRGERLRLWANVRSAQRFQSTLPARGATGGVYKTDDPRNISIHAPREGSDCIRIVNTCSCVLFQSTLPARGATRDALPYPLWIGDFNPRSPRGERRLEVLRLSLMAAISIHAPREGSDASFSVIPSTSWRFQSTLPARGATKVIGRCGAVICISIHAPREGSDLIHSPIQARCNIFQSTLPARGATLTIPMIIHH